VKVTAASGWTIAMSRTSIGCAVDIQLPPSGPIGPRPQPTTPL
jgi:hypothetical protein